MPDVRVDLDRMRTAGSDLHRFAGEFEQADVRSDGIADATGHAGLADADGFGQTDSDLAAAPTGARS